MKVILSLGTQCGNVMNIELRVGRETEELFSSCGSGDPL